MNPSTFHRKLDSVMRDNMYEMRVAGYESGRLHGPSLYKIPTGNKRVFSQKTERLHRAYEVTMLIDMSGSMRWGARGEEKRIRLVGTTATTLAGGFLRNNVDFSIIGFNGMIDVIRPMGSRNRIDVDGIKQHLWDGHIREEHPTIPGRYSPYACTHHDVALETVAEAYKKRTRAERVLVMFTDGHPECGGHNCDRKGRGYISKEGIRKQWLALGKQAHLVAFGINEDITDVFPEAQMIRSAEDFMDKTIKALSMMLRRG